MSIVIAVSIEGTVIIVSSVQIVKFVTIVILASTVSTDHIDHPTTTDSKVTIVSILIPYITFTTSRT